MSSNKKSRKQRVKKIAQAARENWDATRAERKAQRIPLSPAKARPRPYPGRICSG